MESSIPIFFAAIIGFTHAFEADHLVAVSNIVTKRDKLHLAIRDGVYWGLGHALTILLLGLIVLAGRASFITSNGIVFECIVAVMLILLGTYRLSRYVRRDEFKAVDVYQDHGHGEALGIGLIHGVAGSGAMILLVMTEVQGYLHGALFLTIFGIGSIIGMLIAAGVLAMPFSRKLNSHPYLQRFLVWLSSLACILYGGFLLWTLVIEDVVL